MLRLAASAAMNFTSSMCPGERYGGSPGDFFPDARLKRNIPFADMRSRSAVIRCFSATGSGPSHPVNGEIAPYSCGGDLKFAADLAHRRHRNLLPRTLRRCLCLQCRCQEWEQKNCESGFHGATPKGCFWLAEEYTYPCRQGATPPLPATRKPVRRALSLVTRAARAPIRVRLRSVRRSVRRWSGGP